MDGQPAKFHNISQHPQNYQQPGYADKFIHINSKNEKAFRCVQVFGIIHVINSIILLILGITILAEEPVPRDINDNAIPIWSALIFFATGILGIIIYFKRKQIHRTIIIVHNVFAIISYLIAIAVIIVGAFGIRFFDCKQYLQSEATSISSINNSFGNGNIYRQITVVAGPSECSWEFINTYIQPIYGVVILLAVIEIISSIISIFYSFIIYNCCKYGCRSNEYKKSEAKHNKYQGNSSQAYHSKVFMPPKEEINYNVKEQEDHKRYQQQPQQHASSQLYNPHVQMQPEPNQYKRSAAGEELPLNSLPKQRQIEYEAEYPVIKQNGTQLPRQQYNNPTLQMDEVPKNYHQPLQIERITTYMTSKEYEPEIVRRTKYDPDDALKPKDQVVQSLQQYNGEVTKYIPNSHPSTYLQEYSKTKQNDITGTLEPVAIQIKQRGGKILNTTKHHVQNDLPALIN